jgi:zinc finger protein
LANSYIQSLTAPEPDPQLVEEEYKRTEEQDQDLGLDQILTEGYETLEEHANGVKSSAAN